MCRRDREKGTPGMTVTRLEKKLGIKASDTASISFSDCRVPVSYTHLDVYKRQAFGSLNSCNGVIVGIPNSLSRTALRQKRTE